MKNIKQKILPLLLASAVMLLNVMPVYAANRSDSTSVQNQGRVGAVDIKLHQSFPDEQVMIVPNQTVSLESSIENKGKPAWIRVKLEYPAAKRDSNAAGELQALDDSLIKFAEGKWKKIGDYYYLTESVKTGGTVPFTKSITFPSDWDNTMADTQMGIVFTAEAIQEKNFTPDFKSKDPWHGAVIEAFDSDDYKPRTEQTEQFHVIYKDGAEGLITLGDDFFSNWGDLMPGDKLDGTATITNKMKVPVKIFFQMENTGDKKLLDLIKITIKNGDKVIYDGPLSGKVSPAVLLHEYPTGGSTKFTYHISIPKELDNEYALSDFTVVWTFSAEEVIEVIKTGEYGMIIGILGLGVTTLAAGWLMVLKKKGGRGDA